MTSTEPARYQNLASAARAWGTARGIVGRPGGYLNARTITEYDALPRELRTVGGPRTSEGERKAARTWGIWDARTPHGHCVQGWDSLGRILVRIGEIEVVAHATRRGVERYIPRALPVVETAEVVTEPAPVELDIPAFNTPAAKATITTTNDKGHVTWSGRTDDRTAKAVAEYLVTEKGGSWISDDGRTLMVAQGGLTHTVELSASYVQARVSVAEQQRPTVSARVEPTLQVTPHPDRPHTEFEVVNNGAGVWTWDNGQAMRADAVYDFGDDDLRVRAILQTQTGRDHRGHHGVWLALFSLPEAFADQLRVAMAAASGLTVHPAGQVWLDGLAAEAATAAGDAEPWVPEPHRVGPDDEGRTW